MARSWLRPRPRSRRGSRTPPGTSRTPRSGGPPLLGVLLVPGGVRLPRRDRGGGLSQDRAIGVVHHRLGSGGREVDGDDQGAHAPGSTITLRPVRRSAVANASATRASGKASLTTDATSTAPRSTREMVRG